MPRRLGQHLVRGGALALGSVVATQLAVAAAVVAIDSMRKRRTVDVAQLSHTPPWTTEVAGSQITTYTYGVDLYTDMIAAIESARESVFLETFVWKDAEIGRRSNNAVRSSFLRRCTRTSGPPLSLPAINASAFNCANTWFLSAALRPRSLSCASALMMVSVALPAAGLVPRTRSSMVW